MRSNTPLSLLVVLVVGCGSENNSDAGADVNYGSDPRCEAIATRCDPYDTGPGTAHDCHQLAHGNNVAMCVSRMAECFAACSPSDAATSDAATDASSHDVTGDVPQG